MPGVATISQQLLSAVQSLRESQDELKACVRTAAESEREYRQTKAVSLLRAEGRSVADREAAAETMRHGVDTETGEVITLSDIRFKRDLAEGLRVSALEAVRSYRAIVSALQSLAALERSEAELAKYGPQEAWGATP
jgi:hypothetical protein